MSYALNKALAVGVVYETKTKLTTGEKPTRITDLLLKICSGNDTTFLKVNTAGYVATYASNFKEEDSVLIEGYLKNDTYEDKRDGQKKSRFVMCANSVSSEMNGELNKSMLAQIGTVVKKPYARKYRTYVRVAVDKQYGQYAEDSEYFTVVFEGPLADFAADLTEGEKILYTGELKTDRYKNKNGEDIVSTNIFATTLQKIRHKQAQTSQTAQTPADQVQTQSQSSQTAQTPADQVQTQSQSSQTTQAPADQVQSQAQTSQTAQTPADQMYQMLTKMFEQAQSSQTPAGQAQPQTQVSQTAQAPAEQAQTDQVYQMLAKMFAQQAQPQTPQTPAEQAPDKKVEEIPGNSTSADDVEKWLEGDELANIEMMPFT